MHFHHPGCNILNMYVDSVFVDDAPSVVCSYFDGAPFIVMLSPNTNDSRTTYAAFSALSSDFCS